MHFTDFQCTSEICRSSSISSEYLRQLHSFQIWPTSCAFKNRPCTCKMRGLGVSLPALAGAGGEELAGRSSFVERPGLPCLGIAHSSRLQGAHHRGGLNPAGSQESVFQKGPTQLFQMGSLSWPSLLPGTRGKEIEMKEWSWAWGKRKRWEVVGRYFKFLPFISHHPTLLLVGDMLN